MINQVDLNYGKSVAMKKRSIKKVYYFKMKCLNLKNIKKKNQNKDILY